MFPLLDYPFILPQFTEGPSRRQLLHSFLKLPSVHLLFRNFPLLHVYHLVDQGSRPQSERCLVLRVKGNTFGKFRFRVKPRGTHRMLSDSFVQILAPDNWNIGKCSSEVPGIQEQV